MTHLTAGAGEDTEFFIRSHGPGNETCVAVLQVTVYQGANQVKQYEILEEVGDMAVVGNLLFTCRDTYLTVTEMLGKQCCSFSISI